MPATQVIVFAVNVIALIGGASLFVRWLRNWMIQQVAQPVNDMNATVSALKEDIQNLEARTTDAHHRIDNLTQSMLGRTNA